MVEIENNKLYNGEYLKVVSEIQTESIDCIVSDPPYGVGFKEAEYIDDKDFVLNEMPKWYKEWFRVLKPNGFMFLFVGVRNLHQWIQKGIDTGFTYKNIIATRSFNNGSIRGSSNFGFQFQPVLVFSKGNGHKLNEIDFIPTSDCWEKDKRNKNPKPYTYDYPNWIKTEWAFATAKRANKSYHPNEKNVELIKFLIEVATNRDEIVFDSFMGSGSTGVACANADRKFIGIELNKEYFNIACERIYNATRQLKLF